VLAAIRRASSAKTIKLSPAQSIAHPAYQVLRKSSGSLAIFTAIRRASSFRQIDNLKLEGAENFFRGQYDSPQGFRDHANIDAGFSRECSLTPCSFNLRAKQLNGVLEIK
jgi:hypothetical protein